MASFLDSLNCLQSSTAWKSILKELCTLYGPTWVKKIVRVKELGLGEKENNKYLQLPMYVHIIDMILS